MDVPEARLRATRSPFRCNSVERLADGGYHSNIWSKQPTKAGHQLSENPWENIQHRISTGSELYQEDRYSRSNRPEGKRGNRTNRQPWTGRPLCYYKEKGQNRADGDMKSIALVKGQNGDNRDISNHPQKASGYRVVKPDIGPQWWKRGRRPGSSPELTRALPEELKSSLPTIEEIEAELGMEVGSGE